MKVRDDGRNGVDGVTIVERPNNEDATALKRS